MCSLFVKCMMEREVQTFVIYWNIPTSLLLLLKSKCNLKVAKIDAVICFVDISDTTHLCPCAEEVVLRAASTD